MAKKFRHIKRVFKPAVNQKQLDENPFTGQVVQRRAYQAGRGALTDLSTTYLVKTPIEGY